MQTTVPKWIELNNAIIKPNGGFDFAKDKEATKSYFVDYVNKQTVFFHDLEEKLDYMIKNDYYEKEFLDQYSFEQIKNVFKFVYGHEFRFDSFMSAFKTYNNYVLKTDDGKRFLERYEDRVSIVALYLAQGDYQKAMDLAEAMITQQYQPATPTFLNSGRSRRGELVSCFLLNVNDSMNSIGHNVNNALQLSKRGGGVSLDLSSLRAQGEAIKGVEGAASGVVPVMKLLEDSFSYANQLGQRAGSGSVYLNIFHADVEAFLGTKKINADEKTRIKTLSLGLTVPDKFFDLAKNDQDMYLFYPHTVYQEYGKRLNEMDMSEMYDKLVDNPKVKKRRVVARDLLTEIAKTQMESGYPYLFYIDNANKDHKLKDAGRIRMSNLCTEILMLQEESEIGDYGQEDIIRRDISCNLGSLNIYNVMKYKSFEKTVATAIDALVSVVDQTDIKAVPSVAKANKEMRSVGLGAMNLHGYLASNKVMYESGEARDFANTFFMMVRYYSLKRSMEIAKETGVVFRDFEKSEYAKGTALTKYTLNNFAPKTDKGRELFEGIDIPSEEDWIQLSNDIKVFGLTTSYQNAIAPTGSISYLNNASASVAPIIQKFEQREYGDSSTVYPMPYMNETNYFFYKEAYDVDMYKYLDMIRVIQDHVDQGISTTLYVKSDMTTRELARLYIYAHRIGLKTLYYTRTKLLGVEECVSCAV